MKKIVFFLLILLVIYNTYVCKANAQLKKIFIVNSYHKTYPWTHDCMKGFMGTINPMYQISSFDMDTKRIPQKLISNKAEEALNLIRQTNPDIVITMDDNALKFLGQKVADLGINLIFTGINQNPRLYFKNKKIPENATGVLERPLLNQSLRVLNKILGSGHFLLMMDDGMTSEAIIKTTLHGKDKIEYESCDLELFTTSSFPDWKDKVHTLKDKKYKAIIICNYAAIKDKSGKQVPLNTVSAWTSANSPIPVFGFWKYSYGKGKAIGGMLLSGFYQGKTAAKMANIILETDKVPLIKIPNQGDLTFSKHELKRWKINLPRDIIKKVRYVE